MRTTGAAAAERASAEAGGQAPAPVEHDAQRLALGRRIAVARTQVGVVVERGPASDRNGVHRRAPLVHELAALGRRDPLALAIPGRDLPVERRRELEQHERTPLDSMDAERRILAVGFALDLAVREVDLDSGLAQPRDAGTVDTGARVAGGDDDACDPCGDQRLAAGRLASGVIARLEAHIGRRAARIARAGGERDRLGVPLAVALVPALAEHDAIARDHASDDGVGRAPRRPRSASSSVRRSSASSSGAHRAGAEIASTSRRYASPGSGCAKIAEPATSRFAPASRQRAMVAGPTPPSTCRPVPGRWKRRARAAARASPR